MKYSKKERQLLLQQTITDNPFITDEQLASKFHVSVQTIRLDRMELSIPELRERIKDVAANNFESEVKSLPIDEVVGDIIDIELDERALSIFDVGEEHVFQRNRIARGHHLFAQANSLAVAVIDDDLALTAHSDIYFLKPVKAGQRVISKAVVTSNDKERKRTFVTVTSTVDGNTVFTGKFEMYRTKGSEHK
ncbi:transcription factor FapR [Rummeliibacillus stabekisii]|uniref:transcription factor FapR n=1 Tax=Rummeliibacillus stabekisii TaxID=241244 RepID=UPI00116A48F9|nr:transcription factor FapR [Rummeliibacillus stabekisii]MBB5169917.1 acyl-coenzyme A thioesterase PaaI-like protein [Rummeliibacillus stabekisii]GEL04175.1 transcription factor FapR [Rummeliibacillus stabekisii]